MKMKRTRKYEQKRRAEKQAETRLAIIEAAVSLHEEVGPKFTTISAIAERAGVERLTVYRHFPDELSILRACTGHYLALHPFPDPDLDSDMEDPRKQSEAALIALYRYYRSTERMWITAYRDESEVPALHTVMRKVYAYLEEFSAKLAAAWSARGPSSSELRAAIAHSVRFYTWRSLRSQKLTDAQIARLMRLWFSALSRV